MSNHEPVSTAERVRALLEESGFQSVRTWVRRFGHAYTLDEFLEVRTRLGWSRRRFESLAPETRGAFLRAARRRLEAMRGRDFVDDTKVIFATARAAPV
jgi:hypothetical protein